MSKYPSDADLRRTAKTYAQKYIPHIWQAARTQNFPLPTTKENLFPVLRNLYTVMEHEGIAWATGWDYLPTAKQNIFLRAWWNALREAGIEHSTRRGTFPPAGARF